MKTNVEKEQFTESQQQLAYKRETLLALLVKDMKILKGYLSELRELGLELKKYNLDNLPNYSIDSVNTVEKETKGINSINNKKQNIMETNYCFSEHQLVLRQQEELVSNLEKVTCKFGKMKILYSLQTTDEVLCALNSRMKELNVHFAEYKRISSLMTSVYMDQIHSMFTNLENYVGIIEQDDQGDLHCGECLVPYTFCKDLIGKKVRLSLITLNSKKDSKKKYQTFAKHIEIVEDETLSNELKQ